MPSRKHKTICKPLDGLYIGLMSGTSVDGIDAAMVHLRVKGDVYKVTVMAHLERSWPREIRRRLLAVMAPEVAATAEICELNMLTARHFAEAAKRLIKKNGVNINKIVAIGSHGQTICHLPPSRGGRFGSSLQIGDPSVIAALTGITTIGNFRPADMAVGGQGAPLVALVDKLLFSDIKVMRCIQNIGGIGNVTWLPPRGNNNDVIAFDTGPGNMLMDAIVSISTLGSKTYDRDGKLAMSGRINNTVLRKLQAMQYFNKHPPKSTGRELFGLSLAKTLLSEYPKVKNEDLLATATELTAWSIKESYRRFLPSLPEEVILCGGGAENSFLVARIQSHLAAIGCPCIRNITEFGIINKAREAMTFAVLAALTLAGETGNLPCATGADRAVILGQSAIVPKPEFRFEI